MRKAISEQIAEKRKNHINAGNRNQWSVVSERKQEIQIFSRSGKGFMKKGRTKCGKNREGWCRLRRLVCGLAMAVLLAGCADGQK